MPSPVSTDERQPLLPQDGDIAPSRPASESGVWQSFTDGAAALKDFLYENPILICTFCLQFCNYFSKHVVEVPIIKLFEQAICDRHYAVHSDVRSAAAGSIDEQMCKIPAVQNELAGLVGWKFTFDALPGKYALKVP